MKGKLKEFFELNPTQNANKHKDFINYIDTASVENGVLTNIEFLSCNFPSRAQRIVKYDDILYSTVRPNLRHYYHYRKNYDHLVASTGFVLIRNKNAENYSTRFLFYYLSSNSVVKHLSNIAELSQSTFPSFSPKDLGKIDLPELTIEKQTKIASILSAYDDLIENNNKRIKILEQIAENLYKEWFVRFRFPRYETAEFENGIPKGWEVVRVKNCLKRLPFNRLYKQDELESSGKVIVIDQSSNEFMGYHNNEPSHYASFEEPIILFGDHSCKFVLMTKNFSLGENVVPFKSIGTEEFDNYYLYYAVHKLIVTEEYKRHWGRFTAMKIFKPQINLQKKFAEFVKQLIHKKEMLWIQNQNLIKQRDLLLPRLMSGKLEA